MTMTAPPPLLLNDTTARRIGAIRRDITWITDRWADLREARYKGTQRPWRQPVLTPDARAALDAQARLEKHERNTTAPGEHPAPVHVDVLDALDDIAGRADTLHEHVAETIGEPRLPRPRIFAGDATPHLRFIHHHLVTAVTRDPDMLDAAADTVATIRDIAARHLGELLDGQALAAPCPFCHGRTPTHPTGGAHTLRVRVLHLPLPHDADHREPAIVCGNDLCAPNEHQCGMWHQGRPAWPLAEWTWLSNLLAG